MIADKCQVEINKEFFVFLWFKLNDPLFSAIRHRTDVLQHDVGQRLS